MPVRGAAASVAIFVVCMLVALAAGEAILRAKNASMKNYEIEMWRYAKELKRRSDAPALGHEPVPSSSATLQSVGIRINERGLRGGPVAPRKAGQRRILVLGSAVALARGVP